MSKSPPTKSRLDSPSSENRLLFALTHKSVPVDVRLSRPVRLVRVSPKTYTRPPTLVRLARGLKSDAPMASRSKSPPTSVRLDKALKSIIRSPPSIRSPTIDAGNGKVEMSESIALPSNKMLPPMVVRPFSPEMDVRASLSLIYTSSLTVIRFANPSRCSMAPLSENHTVRTLVRLLRAFTFWRESLLVKCTPLGAVKSCSRPERFGKAVFVTINASTELSELSAEISVSRSPSIKR